MCRNPTSAGGNPRPPAVRPPGPVGNATPVAPGGPAPTGAAPAAAPPQTPAAQSTGTATLLQNLMTALVRPELLPDDQPSPAPQSAFSQAQLQTLRAALNSFSDGQRQVFLDAGVRFWPVNSLPREISEAWTGDEPDAPSYAHYVAACRTIRVQPRYWNRHILRHELAHAWDWLRDRRGLVRLEDLSRGRRRAAMRRENNHVAWSHNHLVNAFERYRATLLRFGTAGRPNQRTYELSFDGGGAAMRGYSFQHNVREFYAEGYAVFHGGYESHQVRMYAYARPLFDLLRAEAQQAGQTVPNEAQLQRAGRSEGILR